MVRLFRTLLLAYGGAAQIPARTTVARPRRTPAATRTAIRRPNLSGGLWAIAILMGVEGGHMIDSDLSVLRSYFELGVRSLTLTHTAHTPGADTPSLPPIHKVSSILGGRWCEMTTWG